MGGSYSADGQSFNGFLWSHGAMTDLESVAGDGCDSFASSINSESQVVGTSFPCVGGKNAAIWENGGPAIDLNTLVPPGSDLQLTDAQFINDRGEITGRAVLSDGDEHAFLLIPDDQNDEAASATAATQTVVAPVTQNPTNATPGRLTPEMLAELRARFSHRNRRFDSSPTPRTKRKEETSCDQQT